LIPVSCVCGDDATHALVRVGNTVHLGGTGLLACPSSGYKCVVSYIGWWAGSVGQHRPLIE
jgi:hypothetical protein